MACTRVERDTIFPSDLNSGANYTCAVCGSERVSLRQRGGGRRPLCPIATVRLAVTFHMQSLRIHVDQDRAILVRTQRFRAVAGVALLDFRVRMIEAVAITRCEHDVVRCDGGNESLGRGTFAAVVRSDQQCGGDFIRMLLQ